MKEKNYNFILYERDFLGENQKLKTHESISYEATIGKEALVEDIYFLVHTSMPLLD